MTQLYPDVIVVIPGHLGSSLLDHDGHEIWGLAAGPLLGGLLTLGRTVRRLQLPEGIGDAHPGDGVHPGILIMGIHVIPGVWTINVGYGRLLAHLRSTHGLVEADPDDPDRPVNLVPFAYDWRLSNRYNARRLAQTVQPVLDRWRTRSGNAGAKLVLLCHSMGGLVARWFLDREGGAAYTRTLITIGTPHRGAAAAVGTLVNGVRRGLGPIEIDLTATVRSLPSVHQLMPEYACIDQAGTLHRTTEVTLPHLSTPMVADGLRFHDELDLARAGATAYQMHTVVGINQDTASVVQLGGAGAALLLPATPGDDAPTDQDMGDGTVPSFAARPKGLPGNGPRVRRIAETHAALPGNREVLADIDAILTGTDLAHEPAGMQLCVTMDEVTLVGEPMVVRARTTDPDVALEAGLVDPATERVLARRRLTAVGNGRYEATFDDAVPQAYEVTVGRPHPAGHLLDPVTTATVLIDPALMYG